MAKVMLDVVVRGTVVREEVEKRLEFVEDDYIEPPSSRRCIIPVNDAGWMESLEVDKQYRLTIDDV